MTTIRNAKIESTMLGLEDHGILTAFLSLDYGGSGQGFGGWTFDTYIKDKDQRCGTAWGTEFIRKVLEVLEVDSWEDLKGVNCRVDQSDSTVSGIGHILKDNWFYPERDLARLQP